MDRSACLDLILREDGDSGHTGGAESHSHRYTTNQTSVWKQPFLTLTELGCTKMLSFARFQMASGLKTIEAFEEADYFFVRLR